MKFELLTFKELLGKSFNIPSYQRGYRWEKENVEALLNDIQEFKNNQKGKANKVGGFYCLQPVVVKKNIRLSERNRELYGSDGKDVYDLLDGQQRLTTLWLILNSDRFRILWDASDPNHSPLYTMQYECRKNLFEDAVNPAVDRLANIDLFYLKEALDTIRDWKKGNPLDILNAIVPHNPNLDTDNVRIIWYEFGQDSDKDDGRQSSSIKVFSRLNYGKIALTDTELVKALILQGDIYQQDGSSHSRDVMRERLFRIATEWDDIEKGLHDSQLWCMLTPEGYNPANHMELLLRFVANQIQAEHKYTIIDNQRRDFHIISCYLGMGTNLSPADYADRVDNLWTMIRDAYNAIRNWYCNTDYYNLIGLLVLMQSATDPLPLIKDIYYNYTYKQKDKPSFRLYLESEIGNAIRITEKIGDESDKNKRVRELHELKYGETDKRIIRILEAFNVYLHLCDKVEDSRFDFRKFKEFKVTSLEHIHPQHLDFDDNMRYEDVKAWYDTACKIAEGECQGDETVVNALRGLGNLLAVPGKFGNNVKACQVLVEQIDDIFDAKAGINSGHMHTLYNMALVDRDTNAALGNNLIDAKRHVLQKRESECKTYVPIATKYVFNKHFSESVADMKFWLKSDREAYYAKVKEAYDYFISKVNKNGTAGK